MPSHGFQFFNLPREVRDAIYASLLRDDEMPLVWRQSTPSRHGPGTCDLFLYRCILPDMLRVNRQMNCEYLQAAFEKTRLVVELTAASEVESFEMPSLLSYKDLPQGFCKQLQSASIQIRYIVRGPVFPQVHSVRKFVSDLPALRRLSIDFYLMAELIERHCPTEMQVPPPDMLLSDPPRPFGSLRKVESSMIIISQMLCQNQNYHWTDSKEAKIVGDIWLHHKNRSVFQALPMDGPYSWRGLDLEYQDSYQVSWEALWEECAGNPMPNESPYIA